MKQLKTENVYHRPLLLVENIKQMDNGYYISKEDIKTAIKNCKMLIEKLKNYTNTN